MESYQEKIHSLITGWNRRKESRQSYCSRHGISEENYRALARDYYMSQFKEENPDLFEEIRPETAVHSDEILEVPSLELQYPNGVILRLITCKDIQVNQPFTTNSLGNFLTLWLVIFSKK